MSSSQHIRPLVLSFWTPPAVRPRAIATGKLIPEMIRQGISPVVMTYKTCGEWNVDTPIYKISELRRGRGRLLNLWKEIRYFQYLFRTAKDIIKKHNCNVVFSYSNPQESNILGALLKKHLGIPFISHFSDPWVDNPYKKFSGLSGWKARVLEKFVIKQSDRVLFTNQVALDLVMKKYPARWYIKSGVLNHSFDPREYPLSSSGAKFTISHIGAFYKERTPEALFKALEKLGPEIRKKINIQLIGAINEYANYHGDQYTKWIVPPVSYEKSLAAMKNSDCLVVIDAPFKNSPFFPSKAVDYAGSGTPIIGITPIGSPTSEFLKRLGYWVFESGEIDEIAKCIEGLALGTIHATVDQEFLKQFEAGRVTEGLIVHMKDII